MHSVVYDHQIFCQQEHGGISRYFCELASRIHLSSGFKATVVAPLHFNAYLPECPVSKIGIRVRKGLPGARRACGAASRLLGPPLERVISPALIHRTSYSPHTKQSGVPVVLTVFDMIHELFSDEFGTDDPTIRDKRSSVSGADRILCISERTASDLMRLFDVDRRKISVTHLGLSKAFLDVPQAAETPPHPRPYLLYVGHRAGYKNFELALRAYAASTLLRDEFDFIAFGGFPFTESETALMNGPALRPGSVVRLTGPDAALARAYRHARALVYPSRYEGFGIPPLEAMGSGCVVACSNTSSLPEVVGEAAAMFDPDDLDAIRKTVEDVCFREDIRHRLLTAGRQRARHFSWERCAADTAAAYLATLGVSG